MTTALLPGAAAASETTLVSRQSGPIAAAGDGDSGSAAISANGRFVAFRTQANNLGGPIDPDVFNVYRYDRTTQSTVLVSRQSAGNGGEGGDDSSLNPSISANGRFVAFQTQADNLGGPIEATASNVYVYDVARERVRLVSRQSAIEGGAGAFGGSEDAAISADGRVVAFNSSASNLDGDLNTNSNVFAYDLRRRTVELVSRQSRGAGGEGANGASEEPAVSADGRFVAFQSVATNLRDATVGVTSVYVYDRARERVRLASR